MKEITATGDNPLCGDTITISLVVDKGIIQQAHWNGFGCTLCLDTADMLIDTVFQMATKDVLELAVEDILTHRPEVVVGRTRRGCIKLPLDVMQEALKNA